MLPIYNNDTPPPPNRLKLGYDIAIVLAILLDLVLIFFDQIVMSVFFGQMVQWLSWSGWQLWLMDYQANGHLWFGLMGGLFTVFLIAELLLRWLVAIKNRTYHRWFFFPFVHWYEVLGCFPLLRPLRLLRVFVIIRRLHQMGVQVVPSRLINAVKFYGNVMLEELSDRVILTAVDNFRTQLTAPHNHQMMIDATIGKNRAKIEQTLQVLLTQELLPKLLPMVSSKFSQELSVQVGQAVVQALNDTPEFRRYLKMIPIAGSMIEGQLVDIGRHIGENVTIRVNETLLSPPLLTKLVDEIAEGVAHIDWSSPEVGELIKALIDDGLTAFENQVKWQQHQHSEHLPSL